MENFFKTINFWKNLQIERAKIFQRAIKIFALTLFFFATLLQTTSAKGFLGFEEANSCSESDKVFPVLVICGRNPQSVPAGCQQYTEPCSMGHLIETGRRVLIWIITAVLIVIPIIIAYYGFMIMWTRSWGGGMDIAKYKERVLYMIIYFICLLGAWVIVRLIVDVFQVKSNVPTFMIDKEGNKIEARRPEQFNIR